MGFIRPLLQFLKQVWLDFLDFWKGQLWVAILISLLTFAVQMALKQFTGSVADNLTIILAPYAVLIGGAIIFNITRTIFLGEARAVRHKRSEERRLEHHERAVKAKEPIHPPNLKFRKIVNTEVYVGHEISGHDYRAIVAEVGNELSD